MFFGERYRYDGKSILELNPQQEVVRRKIELLYVYYKVLFTKRNVFYPFYLNCLKIWGWMIYKK